MHTQNSSEKSKVSMTFVSRGSTVTDAIVDGIKTVHLSFRPRDGVTRIPNNVNFTLPDGSNALRTLAEFAAGIPFSPKRAQC